MTHTAEKGEQTVETKLLDLMTQFMQVQQCLSVASDRNRLTRVVLVQAGVEAGDHTPEHRERGIVSLEPNRALDVLELNVINQGDAAKRSALP
jgi:hypothetical protein